MTAALWSTTTPAVAGSRGHQTRTVYGWTAYLGRAPRIADAPEYASAARRSDLSGLAPAWIGVGELDVFHDEDVAYAERLKSCGVPCELVTVPGMYHGADAVKPNAQSMKDFRAGMLDHLRAHLGLTEEGNHP